MNQISPEQRRLEDKCMKELEMKWSRAFSAEMERQARQMLELEPRLAHMSAEEIIKEDQIKRSTCKLCGIICKSWEHLQQHKGMLNCRKRQAMNKGEKYVPENQRPIYCDLCDKTVQHQRWVGHCESQAHKLNLIIQDGRAFKCPICDKTFNGKRPKRMLKNHMCRRIHLKKLEHPKNRESHDALIKLYGFEIDTNALLKNCKKIVVI